MLKFSIHNLKILHRHPTIITIECIILFEQLLNVLFLIFSGSRFFSSSADTNEAIRRRDIELVATPTAFLPQ